MPSSILCAYAYAWTSSPPYYQDAIIDHSAVRHHNQEPIHPLSTPPPVTPRRYPALQARVVEDDHGNLSLHLVVARSSRVVVAVAVGVRYSWRVPRRKWITGICCLRSSNTSPKAWLSPALGSSALRRRCSLRLFRNQTASRHTTHSPGFSWTLALQNYPDEGSATW
jgi:hypothetical protein